MKITTADYLAKRLQNLGIEEVFGLPGDYNFNILDSIIKNPNLKWINSTNELNAGYAADGYARIKGFGAVVTTFGVGELSAINAIGECYSENVPVVKIAGVPKTADIKAKRLLHHNFSNPDYYAFYKTYQNVTGAGCYLDLEVDIKTEIDRVFDVLIKTRKPVYIALPVDVCNVLIEDDIPKCKQESDPDTLKTVVEKISGLINGVKKPLIVADYLIKRFRLQNEVQKISEKFNIKTSALIMGKGLFDEDDKNFIGINYGEVSGDEFKKLYRDFDLILSFGTLFSDLNTLGFMVCPDSRFRVDIQADFTVIDGEKFNNVYINDVIKGILDDGKISPKTHYESEFSGYKNGRGLKEGAADDTPLKLDEVFPLIEGFLRPNDTIIIETGTIAFPSSGMKLKEGSNYITQTMWGSIGWATPAAFGAGMADKTKRPVLFTGEGSHQLTIQEIANFFKYNLKPVIFVLNNGGYTIERVLSNDPDDIFNNITKWDYKKALELFSGGYDFEYFSAKTSLELKNALLRAEKTDKLTYIELFTGKMDLPEILRKVAGKVKRS